MSDKNPEFHVGDWVRYGRDFSFGEIKKVIFNKGNYFYFVNDVWHIELDLTEALLIE